MSLELLQTLDNALVVAQSYAARSETFVLCNCPSCWKGEPLIERVTSTNFHDRHQVGRHWSRVSDTDVYKDPLIPGRHRRFTATEVVSALEEWRLELLSLQSPESTPEPSPSPSHSLDSGF